MGKIKYLGLRFHKRSRLFHAGENLTGFVAIDLKEATSIEGIQLSVYGKPSVRGLSAAGPGCCSNVFTQVEQIVDTFTVFPTASSEHEAFDLQAGFYSFNFSIPIPANIPSSYESKYCKVHYYVTADVEMGPGKASQTRAPFKVINTLDLLTIENVMMSVEQRAHVAVTNTLTGHMGHVDVVFRINRRGYCPGERVHIFGEINNNSTVQVKKSYVELIQVVTLRTNGKFHSVRNAVTGLRHHSIPAGEADIWDTDCLVIPELPPSSLNINPNSIVVSYYLQLVIIPGLLKNKVKVPIEVIIGTITGSPAYTIESTAPGMQVADQLDLVRVEDSFLTSASVSPPPYSPYGEAPPPYRERFNS